MPFVRRADRVIARSGSDEAIQILAQAALDCFAKVMIGQVTFTSLPPGLTPVAYDEVQRVKTPDWEYGGPVWIARSSPAMTNEKSFSRRLCARALPATTHQK